MSRKPNSRKCEMGRAARLAGKWTGMAQQTWKLSTDNVKHERKGSASNKKWDTFSTKDPVYEASIIGSDPGSVILKIGLRTDVCGIKRGGGGGGYGIIETWVNRKEQKVRNILNTLKQIQGGGKPWRKSKIKNGHAKYNKRRKAK